MTVAPFFEEQDFQTGNADLDWQDFVSAYAPGSGRHDLRAMTAYAAYKRSGVVERQSATEAGRSKRLERTSTEATSVEAWEDEGGATELQGAERVRREVKSRWSQHLGEHSCIRPGSGAFPPTKG